MTQKELSTNQIQAIMRELLKDVAGFAADHQKQIILLGGSLLGHVRNEGFIPWDDDVDVGLMRADYTWIQENYVPKNPRFRLIQEHDQDSLVPYMRLVDTESTGKSPYYQMTHGVFIDIFPIDELDEKSIKRKIYLVGHKIINILRNTARSTGAYPPDAKGVPFKKMLRKVIHNNQAHSLNTLEVKWVNIYLKYMKSPAYAGVLNGMHGQKEFFDKNIWQDLVPVTFEGSQVWQVADIDTYLTQLYGDWQTPIKQEQQHAKFWMK
ncbi:LicD family protein [Weissella ceti]|uniref:LicD family protein n=1 Tax=Weissella ceti TaxID=759620 RepID=A0ABT3E3B3_9LACO|nr:LicD family protein [Weissella ceti]MCW0952910.1 LicD family protein [Weissella ceti]QVK11457.1 LicD family protein [Weissella ceti]